MSENDVHKDVKTAFEVSVCRNGAQNVQKQKTGFLAYFSDDTYSFSSNL
jgi:hypothetical protein